MNLRAFAAMLVVLLLTACGKVSLYSQLTEQQANEIVAVLLGVGIDADKELADGKSWVVRTSKDDLPRAMVVLKESGLPREQFKDLSQVFPKDGLVSSPLEERARLIHGLSQELAHTISSIDGVVVARVHVAVPEQDALSEKRRPSSASIFIKYRPDVDIAPQVASIKALVVNSIEGLPYDNVTVTLFPADQAALHSAPPKPHPSSSAAPLVPMWLYPAVVSVAVLVLLGTGAFVWLRRAPRARPGPRAVPGTPPAARGPRAA